MTLGRSVLRIVAVPLLCATALLLDVPVAQAAAPQIKTQAPGVFRMMLGDFEITALSDGTVPLDFHKLLTRTTPAEIDALLARDYLEHTLETSINAFLINTGSSLVLVDTGAGAQRSEEHTSELQSH